ncbi:hypothetical protein ACOMHN_049771 [Nucella lapillus]
MIHRVSQTTKTHRKRRQSYRPEENDEDNANNNRATTSDSSKNTSSRRCRSVAEMHALTDRVMRPTTASQIRSDLREGHGLDPVEVVTQRSSESD